MGSLTLPPSGPVYADAQILTCPGIRLLPITPLILRAAAGLRAALSKLRTPDAIHAATADSAGSTLVLTNDAAFRRIPNLPVVVLDDLLRS